MARQAQEKIPEHINFLFAARTVSFHAGNPACEFDLARSTLKHVDRFTGLRSSAQGTDVLCGLFAPAAVNDRVSMFPEVLIQIHEVLVAVRVWAGHRLASVIEPARVSF